MKNQENTELKGGEIAEEKIKSSENLNNLEVEEKMAKKKSSSGKSSSKRCPSGTRKSKSGKTYRRKTTSKRIRR